MFDFFLGPTDRCSTRCDLFNLVPRCQVSRFQRPHTDTRHARISQRKVHNIKTCCSALGMNRWHVLCCAERRVVLRTRYAAWCGRRVQLPRRHCTDPVLSASSVLCKREPDTSPSRDTIWTWLLRQKKKKTYVYTVRSVAIELISLTFDLVRVRPNQDSIQ